MKKTFISDWWKVFKFTIKQGTSSNGFRGVTILLMVAMFCAAVIINIAAAYSEKNESDIYEIEKCYFINNSDLEMINPEGLVSLYKDNYPNIYFEKYAGSVEELAKKLDKEEKTDEEGDIEYTKDVILEVVNEEDEETKENRYLVKVYVPYDSEVSEDEAGYLGEDFAIIVQQGKMTSIDVPVENQIMSLSQVEIEYVVAGEETEGEDEHMIKFAVSAIIILFLFTLLMIYGQSMGSIVCIEKASKLMEYLLTSVSPQALLFGKITAMSVIAIGQLILWMGMFVAGFVTGDFVAREFIYSEYSNEILQMIEGIRSVEGAANAFTPGAMAVTLLFSCGTILFYFMIAGLLASFVAKADELQISYSIYQIFLMLGFFGGYLSPMFGDERIIAVMRWIPFSCAFMLPGDIINGEVTLIEGMGYLLILILCIAMLVYFTGKAYKNQIFNKGKVGRLATFFKL